VIVDVGFGDPPVWPERLSGPDLLRFAGFDPVEVPVLPLEQHVAEKVHAYTRTYGAGKPSSRVKDLVDLVLVASQASVQAGRLRRALETTFRHRSAQGLPTRIPEPPPDWGPSYRRLATEVSIDPSVSAGHALARTFLDPILSTSVPDDEHWDPTQRTW
jgi:hypothetical protein